MYIQYISQQKFQTSQSIKQLMQAQSVKHEPDSYRFPFSQPQQWKKHLEQKGFVVLKNYLSTEDCEKYTDQLWTIMETLSEGKLDRNDIKTQSLAKNYPLVLHGGMIQYVGHSKAQWKLRTICKPIFETLWETGDLKSSFDGFCFMSGRRNYRARQDDAFLHVDQSPMKDFVWSYQGVMCLTNAGQKEGGFVCIPQSHKEHQNYFKLKELLSLKDNWFVVPEKDKRKHPFQNVLKVNNQAGDFILFDSRTFHCNTVPTCQSLRICTYICMIPEDRVPEEVKQKRKKAFQERRTSNHHPGDGFKMFPRVPRYIQDPKNFQILLKKTNSEYKLSKEELELI